MKTIMADQGNGVNTHHEQLGADVQLMFEYAVRRGKELPNSLSLAKRDDAGQIEAYNELRKLIAPATVESIRYLQPELASGGENVKWYQISLFKKCIWIALFALVLLCTISLSPAVNVENQSKSLLDSYGFTLFINLMFICSAALLGVMFYLLKNFGDKIKNTTLIAADGIQLNAAILIGVMSGFIISELFTINFTEVNKIGGNYIEIKKMTLALLGGFSSDAIFSILQGIVNKIKGLVTSTEENPG